MKRKGIIIYFFLSNYLFDWTKFTLLFLSTCSSFHDFHEAMDASLLKEKEKEKERGGGGSDKTDKDRDRERRSKLNNSSQIVASNHTNNNAHIKQRNNIHSNSSNEVISPPSEHLLRLEADIKRLKADLQVRSLLSPPVSVPWVINWCH